MDVTFPDSDGGAGCVRRGSCCPEIDNEVVMGKR